MDNAAQKAIHDSDMVNIIALINDKFLTSDKMLKIQLESIQLQLKTINDKVDKSDKAIDGINSTINNMILSETRHYVDCPNTKAISVMRDTIDKDNKPRDLQLSEITFIIKYWKIFGIAYILFVISTFGSLVVIFEKFKYFKPTMEQVNKNTQSINDIADPNTYNNTIKK